MVKYIVKIEDDCGHKVLHNSPKVITGTTKEHEVMIDKHGAILLDIVPPSHIECTCISTQWQASKPLEISTWEFEDITQTDFINEITITGTSQQVYIPSTLSPNLENLISTFKSRTDTLLNILSTT